MSKTKDIAFGLSREISCKALIETITGQITQTEKFDLFDYYNEKYLVELKSRRNNHNTYPTTMVGYNKIKNTIETKTKVFFFNFFDGLYYHIYDSSNIYEIKKSGRYDRGCAEISDYLFIPIELLTKV